MEHWVCSRCGSSYFEDCSPYYVTCLECNNSGNEMEDIADWIEEE